MKNYDLIKEFTEKVKQPVGVEINEDGLKKRIQLIFEEFTEVLDAAGYRLEADCLGDIDVCKIKNKKVNKVELLKELCDLEYVTVGTSVTFGLPHEKAFIAVHENNLTKVSSDGTILTREDGKVLKPEGYRKVDLSDLVGE